MRELDIICPNGESVAGLWSDSGGDCVLVLAHGAGAGMRHAFMESLAEALASAGVNTLRYQFPYVQRGSRRPDPPAVLTATVRAACAQGLELAGSCPVFAGGKSMGGRMTSTAASAAPLDGVHGLVFFGFPLHPAGRPGTKRAAHLTKVHLPLLFLQGTRDKLAELDLLTPIVESHASASLHVVDGADHGFHVLKRSGRTVSDVIAELVRTTARFLRG